MARARFSRFVARPPRAGWSQTAILVPAERGTFDEIGRAVALSGDLVALNAPGDDDEGPDFGAVYTFSFSGATCPTLQSFPRRLSLAQGGVLTMLLRPGVAHAGQPCVVVGDFTGTNPGFGVGSLLFPLNQDDWLSLVFENPDTGLFGWTQGTLDGLGRATATFTLPGGLPPALAGIRFHWAYALLDGGAPVFASTPVLLRLDPRAPPLASSGSGRSGAVLAVLSSRGEDHPCRSERPIPRARRP